MWYFITGYVKINVKGLSIESFLNSLARYGIRIADLKRLSRTKARLVLSRSDYIKAQRLIKSGSIECEVFARRGIPYIVKTLLSRPALAAGIMLMLALVYLSGDFVASVRFIGDFDAATLKSLQNTVENLGIYRGAYMRGWDFDEKEELILRAVPNLIFVSMSRAGMDVTIEAIQASIGPEPEFRYEPCNIVSDKDCKLYKISVLSGTPVVREGDVVSRGDLLVSGVVEVANRSPLTVRAIADIRASVWYSFVETGKTYDIVKNPTGRSRDVHTLVFGGKTLFQGKFPDYGHYDESKRTVELLPGIMPMYLDISHLSEYHASVIQADILERRQYLCDKALQGVLALVPEDAEIVDQWVNIDMNGDDIIVEAFIEVIEDVGVQVPMYNEGVN